MTLKSDGRYLSITLAGRHCLVHRIMLIAFVSPPPFDGAQTRHLNGKSQDNRLDNLAWGTATENQFDRFDHGTACAGEDNYRAILTEAKVRQIMSLRPGNGPTRIAKMTGCERSLIKQVIYGQSWNWLTGLPRNRH